ncbi:MAG: glycosyltransferase [Mariniphaga sp.]
MPKVSVIVPNYNHAKYLHQRLDSIFNQTFQDIEVILLDDCSTDYSREILEQYRNHPKVSTIIFNESNSGSTFKQWIKGIELAKGEYIWIAESDDFAEYIFLETAMNIFQTKKCSIFFTQSFIVNEYGITQGKWNEYSNIYKNDFIADGKEIVQNYLINSNIIPNTSAVLFKKDLLSDTCKTEVVDFKINGDWFLWINLLFTGDLAFHRKPLNYFRRHKEAGSPKNVTNFKNIEEAFKINVFLKNHGFKIDSKKWLNAWIFQAGYSLKVLLKSNFWNIYKLSFNLLPVPMTYLIYKIIKYKIEIYKHKH